MEYSVFKLDFSTGVHFGKGMLNDSMETFTADMLFSALYIEALKLGKHNDFYQAVETGRLLFSDAFPFIGKQYMLPKPVIYVEHSDQGDSEKKKRFKAMKYLPVEKLDLYLSGNMDLKDNPMEDFGTFEQRAAAFVRKSGETLPYQVGVFHYKNGNGLYILTAYESKEELRLFELLMDALSYSGIGGKKAEGLGKFTLRYGTGTNILIQHLNNRTGRFLLLSSALPRDDELEQSLVGASYMLSKHSGFVTSDQYADEARRKKDLYLFDAGSCFCHKFDGDIYDVSEGGNHAVYRYGKALFMEV